MYVHVKLIVLITFIVFNYFKLRGCYKEWSDRGTGASGKVGFFPTTPSASGKKGPSDRIQGTRRHSDLHSSSCRLAIGPYHSCIILLFSQHN